MSLFSDNINTWDVGKTLTYWLVILNFFSCSPNIPRVYMIREQRHGKRVLLLNLHECFIMFPNTENGS